tara:strand:+ start:158 stop:280 length:123 start_codon:yes stop_codon:yes gene_type:complete
MSQKRQTVIATSQRNMNLRKSLRDSEKSQQNVLDLTWENW